IETSGDWLFGNSIAGPEFSGQNQFAQAKNRTTRLRFGLCGRAYCSNAFFCRQSDTLHSLGFLYTTVIPAIQPMPTGTFSRQITIWHSVTSIQQKSACQNNVDTKYIGQISCRTSQYCMQSV